MFRIGKEFRFQAAHRLHGLPDGHQCARVHGHGYLVVVYLAGESVNNGMLMDFAALAPVKDFIDEHLDHRMLNDLWVQPTAELVARNIFHVVEKLVPLPDGVFLDGVRVWETDTCWAEYRP